MNHYLVWLSRLHRCRGFGVQSPSVYWFIRYVVNEHYPYYAYAELKACHHRAGYEAHHIGRLLFRIANYLQADCCLLSTRFSPSVLQDYIHHGCKKMQIVDSPPASVCPFVVVDADAFTPESLDGLCVSMPSEGVLVLLHIKQGTAARTLWRHVIRSKDYGVTLDLYYCGIIFFDRKKYKANYVVNY